MSFAFEPAYPPLSESSIRQEITEIFGCGVRALNNHLHGLLTSSQIAMRLLEDEGLSDEERSKVSKRSRQDSKAIAQILFSLTKVRTVLIMQDLGAHRGDIKRLPFAHHQHGNLRDTLEDLDEVPEQGPEAEGDQAAPPGPDERGAETLDARFA